MNKLLAIAAMLLAVGAFVAGDGPRALPEVEAVQLAEWIRSQRSVTVIDLRSPFDFQEYHIPSAANIGVLQIAEIPFARTDTLVLYGARTDVTDAASELKRKGARAVYGVKDGIDGWVSDVMNPALPKAESAADSASNRARGELSRYFGGKPRVASDTVPATTADFLKRMKRRTC